MKEIIHLIEGMSRISSPFFRICFPIIIIVIGALIWWWWYKNYSKEAKLINESNKAQDNSDDWNNELRSRRGEPPMKKKKFTIADFI